MVRSFAARWSYAAALVVAGLGFAGAASAQNVNCPTGVDLSGNPNYVQFGDGISYSLPILGLEVQSSPGQINDCIVIMSGAGGSVVNNGDLSSIDNAYENCDPAMGATHIRTLLCRIYPEGKGGDLS